MSLTPIFHPEEDWLKAMVDKDQGSLVPQNREEEWYSEIINSMQSGGSSGDGGVEIVRFEKVKPADSDTSGTCDHTFEQMILAATSGKTIMCYIADANGYVTPTGIMLIDEYSIDAFMSFVYCDDTKIYKITAYMTSENVVTITREEVQ
jgi:hypothetical protein